MTKKKVLWVLIDRCGVCDIIALELGARGTCSSLMIYLYVEYEE